jgi:TPR repeat protein
MSAWPEREALADAIIRLVATQAPDGDWELQFALYQAYELGISAGLHLAGRLGQRFHHMRLAALASEHPLLLCTVAYHYWHGLNEVSPNEAEAERWFARSAQTGDPDALRSYAEFKSRVQPATLKIFVADQ